MTLLVGLAFGTPARAVSFPATGSLAIEIVGLPILSIPGSGTVVVNGSAGGGHLDSVALPAGFVDGRVVWVADPEQVPFNGLQLTAANEAGTIANGSGPIPLVGAAKICLFGACSAAVANINVPLDPVGEGGARFITASVMLTVVGASWTTATASVGTITRMGSAHGPMSVASSTATPSGQLRLVTPIFLSTNIPASPIVPAFGILALHFVPEPATLALVSAGLALLAAAGRTRLARH